MIRYLKFFFGICMFIGIIIYAIYKNYMFISTYEESRLITETMAKDILWEEIRTRMYDYLNNMIHNDWFTEKYGRGKLKAKFLNRYYTTVICHPDFINGFLDKPETKMLLLNELNHMNKELATTVNELFCKYVEQSIHSFESKIKYSIDIILGIKTVTSLKNVFHGTMELYNISVADIVTPGAQENMVSTKQKLVHLAISGIILLTLYITKCI